MNEDEATLIVEMASVKTTRAAQRTALRPIRSDSSTSGATDRVSQDECTLRTGSNVPAGP